MGRFTAEQADNYGGKGGHGFFSLANDGDTAKVRFMYRDMQDVEGYAVHQVEVNGKKRYVNCLRDYNQPLDECPFCKAGKVQQAKLFIPIYDIDTGETKIWERGKKFFANISSLCSRYPNLVSHVMEIERHGKKGDTDTTYMTYEVDRDDTTLDDLPELPVILGGLVLDKSYDEMCEFLDTGDFPDSDSQPVQRRGSDRDSYNRGSERETYTRRTPANTRGDKF